MKILLIDDSKIVRDILKENIQSRGYEIVGEAADGEEGILKYKELNPDLVILDISMPKCNGLQCLRVIKEYDENAKILLCSAIGQRNVIIQGLQLGAADYLIKPFDEKNLIKKIEEIIKEE